VTANNTTTSTNNPLRQLPSVLSLPDLQPRLARVLRALPLTDERVADILKLDPLAVVRGLRAANTAAFGRSNVLPTVPGLVRALGGTLSKQLFLQPAGNDQLDEATLQQLWRHAVATAIAAEGLSARSGLLEPEVAYLLGLLHDLPEWLRRLSPSDNQRAATDWILQWQLPAPFVSLLLAVEMSDPATSTEDPPDPATLIRAAELLAEMAGFRHPEGDDGLLEQALSGASKIELGLADELRRNVEGVLRTFGLDASIPAEEFRNEEPLPGATPTGGRLDEVVLSILGCTRSESYRGIVTALTAAALRYGRYDRVFYAKWNDVHETLHLRLKADSSSRRIAHNEVRVTPAEATALRDALLTNERPAHLVATGAEHDSLLGTLSTDELLAVPLNPAFETPSFLLLDRSLTLRSIDGDQDLPLAMMLGMTGSLLIENLLLRRRRQRAQKFALTDPLTRLFNRRMGIVSLEQAMSMSEREQRSLTVLMCDLDHFKRLNDTLGHLQGDAALKATADVLRHTLRKSDTVCRYGGEEFLVVLPDTTPDDATVLATRMFTAVHARGEELGLPMTISIGLTSHRQGDTVESLLHRADRALYASKGYGRNRFSADVDEPEVAAPPGPDAPATAPPERPAR